MTASGTDPRAGLPRGTPVVWTPTRLARLTDLMERGYTTRRAAKALKVSEGSVRHARRRYAIPPARQQRLTAVRVARLIGHYPETVRRWLRAGYLVGTATPTPSGKVMWMVHYQDVLAFLENPDHWHRWDPTRIPPESGFATWATTIRAGVRFLSTREVADRLYAQERTVLHWVATGTLRAYREADQLYFRADDIAGFVAPSQKTRDGTPQRTWSASEDATLLRLRAEGQTFRAIGAVLGRSPGSADLRHARLTSPGRLMGKRRGASHPRAKFSEDDIRAIRAAWSAGGITQRELARQYDTDQAVIGRIVRHERWAWLPDREAADD